MIGGAVRRHWPVVHDGPPVGGATNGAAVNANGASLTARREGRAYVPRMSIRADRAGRSALHLLCTGLAAGAAFIAEPSDARAQEPALAQANAVTALVKVHIESPEEVDLEMKKDADWVKALVEAYHSDETRKFVEDTFKGSVLASW